MAPKFLNKKFFFACPPKPWRRMGFLFLVIIIILGMGGFFLYKEIEKQSPYKTLWENEYVQDKEFEVKETTDGKIVENKKEGLIIKGPSNWSVVKEGEDIAIVSPEVKYDEKGNLIFNSIKEGGGCGVAVRIMKCKKVDSELPTWAENLDEKISYLQNNKGSEQKDNIRVELVTVGGKIGVKRSYTKDEKIGSIEIQIPLGQTIYYFYSGLIFNQKCVDSFNDILGTVLINK